MHVTLLVAMCEPGGGRGRSIGSHPPDERKQIEGYPLAKHVKKE